MEYTYGGPRARIIGAEGILIQPDGHYQKLDFATGPAAGPFPYMEAAA